MSYNFFLFENSIGDKEARERKAGGGVGGGLGPCGVIRRQIPGDPFVNQEAGPQGPSTRTPRTLSEDLSRHWGLFILNPHPA